MVSPPPPPPWPGGKRFAAAVTFDVDMESMLLASMPETAHRHSAALSYFGYDRVAVPRILERYRRMDVRQTFFVPGWCMERHPDLMRAIVADGHEIGLHGYVHEVASTLGSRAAEAELLERALEAMDRVLGRRPSGWRAPVYGFSPDTAELLVQAGISYDSSLMGDDLPYLLRTPAGELIELPVDWANDDWPQYAQSFEFQYHMTTRAPARAAEVYRAEIDAARELGGLWIGVWHPCITGRQARLNAALGLLQELLDAGDAWVATLEEIAVHVRGLADGGEWQPRAETFPAFNAPDPAALRLLDAEDPR
jgi:peptidoglycan/xylan/chitin deacetylase (PgdA/CDA1 family)